MIIYDYIYYHFFGLVSRYRKINARESALLYIAAIIYFLTLPFAIIPLYSIYNFSSIFFMIFALGYAALIYFLNKKYFGSSKRIKRINQRFKNESVLQRKIGYTTVILLLLSSFALFFFFLSLL